MKLLVTALAAYSAQALLLHSNEPGSDEQAVGCGDWCAAAPFSWGEKCEWDTKECQHCSECSVDRCPELGHMSKAEWLDTINNNDRDGKLWFNGLPPTRWWVKSGPAKVKATLAKCQEVDEVVAPEGVSLRSDNSPRCEEWCESDIHEWGEKCTWATKHCSSCDSCKPGCPSLGNLTQTEWLDRMTSNQVNGVHWSAGLPQSRWIVGKGPVQITKILKDCSIDQTAPSDYLPLVESQVSRTGCESWCHAAPHSWTDKCRWQTAECSMCTECKINRCPSLGKMGKWQWVDQINMNIKAGSRWFEKLPTTGWWVGKGPEQVKTTLKQCTPVQEVVEATTSSMRSEGPRCEAWCSADAHAWQDKCGWDSKHCSSCDMCKPVCPLLGGLTQKEWIQKIENNTVAQAPWFTGLPQMRWTPGKGPKEIVATMAGCRVETNTCALGSWTKKQWLDKINANVAEGKSQWFADLPTMNWRNDLSVKEVLEVLATCHAA